MSYAKDMKSHMVRLMAPGDHKHQTMTDATNCDSCGKKFAYAQKEYKRLLVEHPDKFIRQDTKDSGYSKETQNLGQMLEDRIKRDKLYRNHLKVLAFGTEEEKKRELKRLKNGFYEQHTAYDPQKFVLLNG